MIPLKSLKHLLPIILLALAYNKTTAQKIDRKTYQHKMDLMEQLSIYNMTDYDTLFHITALDTSHSNQEKDNYYGWIEKRDTENLRIISTNGKAYNIDQKSLKEIETLPVNKATVQIFTNKLKEERYFRMGDFGKNYLLNLWLYKKGHEDYSKQLLPKNDTFFNDGFIVNDFGILYYDEMLRAYSYKRDYKEAMVFGKHLSKTIFQTYEYQKEAIALTAQLQEDTADFKTFHLPDSLEWNNIKQQLSRKEQILFLVERLRLLNCIQPGQPADINYSDYQYSISIAESRKLKVEYWVYSPKYTVINPYTALIQMKLSPQETALLLPGLLDETYIPSYYYFRDFMSSRTLFKVSRVTHHLLFEITDKGFYTQQPFDSLSLEEKKAEVEKIREWCNENAGLTHEAVTIKTLKTANKWGDFQKALETASVEKYDSLVPIIVLRFNDFNNENSWTWPTYKGTMAKTMFELGDATYTNTVKTWSKDTSDNWVNLWASLFLLKNDESSYEYAMTSLEAVLKKCDGSTYYPHAMDFLLSRNDKRALKLAEGIVDKQRFEMLLISDSYIDFVKKLLLLKSDYTFHNISEKLDHFTPDETEQLKNTGRQRMLMQSDFYVLAVDKLKSDVPGYLMLTDINAKLTYKKVLKEWFDNQYQLLKEGKPNELQLTVTKEELPVKTIDTPHY